MTPSDTRDALFEDAFQQALAGDLTSVSKNLPQLRAGKGALLPELERAIEAHVSAEQFQDARRKLEIILAIDPDRLSAIIRLVEVLLRTGEAQLAYVHIMAAEPLIREDGQFLWMLHHLMEAGQHAEARTALFRFEASGTITAFGQRKARAVVYANTGHVSRALDELTFALREESCEPTLFHFGCDLADKVGRYDLFREWTKQSAVRSGTEARLRVGIGFFCDFFMFGDAFRLLDDVASAHGERLGPVVEELRSNVEAQATAAADAVAQHGPLDFSDPARLLATLADHAASPSAIVWARQTLVAFLSAGAIAEEDVVKFSANLPNWEYYRAKHAALAAGLRGWPRSSVVNERWLRHLMMQRCYGDAVDHVLSMSAEEFDEDALFIVAMLLSRHHNRLPPRLMLPGEVTRLEAILRERLGGASPEFRVTMHRMLGEIGIDLGAWPNKLRSVAETYDNAPVRHFFAESSGRLNARRSSAGPRAPVRRGRAAVVITGQLRGFETAWPSIFRHLVAPTQAPVFISTWDTTVNARGRHARRLERLLPDDVVSLLPLEERYTDLFEKAYPRTASLLFDNAPVTVEELHAILEPSGVECPVIETESDTALDHYLSGSRLSGNMIKMFYKFARGDALLADYEQRTGERFGHVIWSRPDCDITGLPESSLLSCLSSEKVVYSSWVTDRSVGDYLVVYPREAFAEIGSVFRRKTHAWGGNIYPWRPRRDESTLGRNDRNTFGGPETIFDTLLSIGVYPTQIQHCTVQLVGRTPRPDVIRASFHAERTLALAATG